MSSTIEFAKHLRMSSLRMVHNANASHIGSALSICDIVAVLYYKILNINPEQPKMDSRDRFILSKGHACVAIYSALAARGFFPLSDLNKFGRDHSEFMTHISHYVPGVEFSTGSLGHGLPFAVGKALAAKKLGKKWRTFVVLSDGELDEGSNWEAMLFACHHKLDNLIAIIDYNKLQSLSSTENTLRLEPLADKARAFGWEALEIDGHDHAAISHAIECTPWKTTNPSFLIAHTIKGKGVSFMENNVSWHYKTPSSEQLRQALKEIEIA